jgi:sulfonate transport system substrate-binding protein
VIWDPFLAAAEKQIGARILADGVGFTANHQFYLAARPYADRRPDVVKIVIEEIAKIDEWGKQNPNEVVAFLAPAIGIEPAAVDLAVSRFLRENPKEVARILAGYTGLDVPTFERVLERRPSFRVSYVESSVADEQQTIADTFQRLNLIPKSIVVKGIVWHPAAVQAAK